MCVYVCVGVIAVTQRVWGSAWRPRTSDLSAKPRTDGMVARVGPVYSIGTRTRRWTGSDGFVTIDGKVVSAARRSDDGDDDHAQPGAGTAWAVADGRRAPAGVPAPRTRGAGDGAGTAAGWAPIAAVVGPRETPESPPSRHPRAMEGRKASASSVHLPTPHASAS